MLDLRRFLNYNVYGVKWHLKRRKQMVTSISMLGAVSVSLILAIVLITLALVIGVGGGYYLNQILVNKKISIK